jgi:hypothetical protein
LHPLRVEAKAILFSRLQRSCNGWTHERGSPHPNSERGFFP